MSSYVDCHSHMQVIKFLWFLEKPIYLNPVSKACSVNGKKHWGKHIHAVSYTLLYSTLSEAMSTLLDILFFSSHFVHYFLCAKDLTAYMLWMVMHNISSPNGHESRIYFMWFVLRIFSYSVYPSFVWCIYIPIIITKNEK